MNWATPHFTTFEFSVGDTLRIYNYMTVGHPQFGRLGRAAATEVAAAEGRAWCDANAAVITDTLGDAVRVTLWEDWKKRPGFDNRLARLVELFGSSAAFRECLRGDIAAYVRRHSGGRVVLDAADSDLLATYLLEEMAVYQLQAEARPTVNIYPGGMPTVLRALGAIGGIPRALATRHYAYIDMHEPRPAAVAVEPERTMV